MVGATYQANDKGKELMGMRKARMPMYQCDLGSWTLLAYGCNRLRSKLSSLKLRVCYVSEGAGLSMLSIPQVKASDDSLLESRISHPIHYDQVASGSTMQCAVEEKPGFVIGMGLQRTTRLRMLL